MYISEDGYSINMEIVDQHMVVKNANYTMAHFVKRILRHSSIYYELG